MNKIFSYMRQTSYGVFNNDYGDFSVVIYDNQELHFGKHFLGQERPYFTRIIKLKNQTYDMVLKYLEANKENILNMPSSLDNGSCDGYIQIFEIFGKQITALNLSYFDIQELKTNNFNYYELYSQNVIYENFLMELFMDISNLLKKDNLDLTLYSFEG